jgi:hypothetical protein
LKRNRAGKGVGYQHWAKKFNLKQMAQTLSYLQENGLLDYQELAQKAASAKARSNELSAGICAAEKRLAEVTALKKHIINYSNTREIYVAYRKAGYSGSSSRSTSVRFSTQSGEESL